MKTTGRRLLVLLALFVLSGLIEWKADVLPSLFWYSAAAFFLTAIFGFYTLVMFWTPGKR